MMMAGAVLAHLVPLAAMPNRPDFITDWDALVKLLALLTVGFGHNGLDPIIELNLRAKVRIPLLICREGVVQHDGHGSSGVDTLALAPSVRVLQGPATVCAQYD